MLLWKTGHGERFNFFMDETNPISKNLERKILSKAGTEKLCISESEQEVNYWFPVIKSQFFFGPSLDSLSRLPN